MAKHSAPRHGVPTAPDAQSDLSRGAVRMTQSTVSSRSAAATRRAKASRGHGHGSHVGAAQVDLGGLRERRRPPRWPWVAVIVVLLVLIGFGGRYAYQHLFTTEEKTVDVEPGQEVSIKVAEGSSASAIAQQLYEAGVIGDTSAFMKAARKQNVDEKLKPGTYIFVTGSDVQNVIDLLVAGPNSGEGILTIAEGLTVRQTAAIVEDRLGISADDFIAQAKASSYVDDYTFLADAAASGYDSLEGYLFPKTYDFSSGAPTADSVIRTLLDQYALETQGLDFASAEAQIADAYGVTMSDYDILKLASVIEREAVADDQRGNVASVFYNRLAGKLGQGAFLQSDAVMGYVTGGEVTADDLQQDSPYNTYKNEGLPPTPICAPSMASLEAALAPESTDYLYFWITDSEAVFSKTYEEHQAAIANAS